MKRFVSAWVVVLLCAAGQASCYRTRIEMGGHAGWAAKNGHASGEAAVDHNAWEGGQFYHNFVLGLVDVSGPIRLDQSCPQGVSYIEQRTSFLSGLVGGLTGGIYTPQYVEVVCVGGE